MIPKAQAQELMASADSFRARRLVPYTSSKLEVSRAPQRSGRNQADAGRSGEDSVLRASQASLESRALCSTDCLRP